MADSNSNVFESGENLDRIRDIIFGPQIRDYEQRFEILKRDLERLQQEFDSLAEQLTDQDSNQNKKLQIVRRDMRQADGDLRGELRQTAQKLGHDKVDRIALGELFVDLGNHLKAGGVLTDLVESLKAANLLDDIGSAQLNEVPVAAASDGDDS